MGTLVSEVSAPEIVKPNFEVVQAATWKAFKGKMKDEVIQSFLDATTGRDESAPAKLKAGTLATVKAATPMKATGSLYFALLYGVISCKPFHSPFVFEESSWGIGATAMSSGGVLYTAYEQWDDFWNLTTGYHAQGIAEAGGIFQINFFNKQCVPIGQFDGVAGGIGVFECGGRGKWYKK